MVVGVRERNFYRLGLSWNKDFRWRRLLKLLQYFFEGLVEIAADNARLRSRPNQVLENWYVELTPKPDHIELWVNAVEHIYQFTRCLYCLLSVPILAISQENNQKLFYLVLNNCVPQAPNWLCEFCASWIALKADQVLLKLGVPRVRASFSFTSELNQGYLFAIFFEKLFSKTRAVLSHLSNIVSWHRPAVVDDQTKVLLQVSLIPLLLKQFSAL